MSLKLCRIQDLQNRFLNNDSIVFESGSRGKTKPYNPYHIFVMTSDPDTDKSYIISPFHGKTLRFQGLRLVLSNNSKSVNLKTLKSEGVTVSEISDNSGRIFWNVEEMQKLSRSGSRGLPKKYRKFFDICFSTDFYTMFMKQNREEIFDRVKANSVLVNEKPALWRGYRSSKPKSLIVVGASGIGKSTAIRKYAKKFNLDQPLWISYDTPYDYIGLVEIMTKLEKFSNIRKVTGLEKLKATDKSIFGVTYPFSSSIEDKLIKFSVEHKIDTIYEKASFPSESEIKRLQVNNDVRILIIEYNSEDQRRSNMIVRFQNTGRYGVTENPITKSSVKKYVDGMSKIVKIDIVDITP